MEFSRSPVDFQWTSTGFHWSSLEFTGIRGAEESIGKLYAGELGAKLWVSSIVDLMG